jgi:DNA polymerase-3 subunit delta'
MLNWLDLPLHDLLRDSSRLPHALLIRGPAGIGKEALGHALAQALLCEKPTPDGIACGACSSCHWFANAAHPDFQAILPAADQESGNDPEEGAPKAREAKASPWISIEQVRALHDFIHVSSHRGGRKIILVNPAEALNMAAANALLKNLEEPPAGIHFILISHRPQRLMRTIVSRCRQLVLRKPGSADAIAWLAGQGVRDPAVALAQASGAPLLALAMTAGDELAGRRELLQAIADADFDPLAVADSFKDLPLERFIRWMQKWTCDIVEQRMLGRIRYNPDLSHELAVIGRRVEPLAALRLHRKLVREQRNIHHPLNARLFMESVLFAYAALLNPARRAA